MNPQDAETEETIDDLGVLIISDSQCEEIEEIFNFCKYCIITTTVLSCCIVLIVYMTK
jgi:hypothetical protein